jgi:hypothetical protein
VSYLPGAEPLLTKAKQRHNISLTNSCTDDSTMVVYLKPTANYRHLQHASPVDNHNPNSSLNRLPLALASTGIGYRLGFIGLASWHSLVNFTQPTPISVTLEC